MDIDNFKPFNDLYGYAKGDEVLLCLAHCLNESVDPSCDFVGHIGGDDFLLVLTSTDWERRIEQLLQEFHRRCRLFYRSEHLAAGCFIASSREGHEQRYPLLALSIGAVRLRAQNIEQLDAGGLAALASDAKRQAKQESGSSLYLIDSADLPAAGHKPSLTARAL